MDFDVEWRVFNTEWRPITGLIYWLCVGAAVVLSLFLIFDDDGFLSILNSADLMFHEAGHVFFGIFGSTMGLYGGTLGQFVFPSVALFEFKRRGDVGGFFIAWLWFAENIRYVAVYLGDARRQALPLLGGGEHDWFNILSRWGLLEWDTRLAGLLSSFCGFGIIAAVAWISYRYWQVQDGQDIPPVI